MTNQNKLTIDEVEEIAVNAIKAASMHESWRPLGLNIEMLARQLADTMRENERLRLKLNIANQYLLHSNKESDNG